MKRPHLEKDSRYMRIFTLFRWNQCDMCQSDFRRELGWRYMTGPFYAGVGLWVYVCGECKIGASK